MARKSKKRCSMLLAQPGYMAQLRIEMTRTLNQLNKPVAATLCSPPSMARWRMIMDRVTRLLQAISEQMEEYSGKQPESWQRGVSADRFYERLDKLNDLLAQLDDLRSEF
jgi:hypothetical protein